MLDSRAECAASGAPGGGVMTVGIEAGQLETKRSILRAL